MALLGRDSQCWWRHGTTSGMQLLAWSNLFHITGCGCITWYQSCKGLAFPSALLYNVVSGFEIASGDWELFYLQEEAVPILSISLLSASHSIHRVWMVTHVLEFTSVQVMWSTFEPYLPHSILPFYHLWQQSSHHDCTGMSSLCLLFDWNDFAFKNQEMSCCDYFVSCS